MRQANNESDEIIGAFIDPSNLDEDGDPSVGYQIKQRLPEPDSEPLVQLRVIFDTNLTEEQRVQHSRSPARAKRRTAQGHQQHFVIRRGPSRQIIQLPDGTLVMHPVLRSAFEQEMRLRQQKQLSQLQHKPWADNPIMTGFRGFAWRGLPNPNQGT